VISRWPEHLVFHSGTSVSANGKLVTNGGRVLVVVTIASELMLAAAKATKACGKIVFEGAQYRTDIAHKGIVRSVHHTSMLQHDPSIGVNNKSSAYISFCRSLLQEGRLSYRASGVDIVAGDTLVNRIKRIVELTNRDGVLGSIGGFGGLFDVKAAGYKDPLLISGTDGVGTKLKVSIFWNVTPCRLVEVYWRFRGTYCLDLQGQKQAEQYFISTLLVHEYY
jgi:phosphoribosylamine--glycine ligase/phosphoribosylglycinamide formyltransferase/phosphoribosylformylglycinamidine cyclo-ligase